MRRKILSAFMVLVLCVGLMATARADYFPVWNDDLDCDFDESTGLLTITGTGQMIVDGTIEDDYGQFPWDDYRDEIKEIVIGDGITEIGMVAFAGCHNLVKVTIPSSVEIIEDSAFDECTSLSSISIPEGVTYIRDAFDGCSSLTSITIPKSVTRMDHGPYSAAFNNCENLSAIYVEEGNPVYTSIDGVLIEKNEDSDRLSIFRFPAGHPATSYTIPDGITGIAAYAFQGCNNLVNLVISDSVTGIGRTAFFECTNLVTVQLSDSMKRIGTGETFDSGIFGGCTALTSIYISQNLKTIDERVFSGCKSLADIYYAGSEEQWKGVSIYSEWNEALFAATVHYNSTPSDMIPPTVSTEPVTATPTTSTVLVNGESVSFDAYNIGGANYFKLRDLACVLSGTEKQFAVGWSSETKTISLTSGQPYTAIGGELVTGASQAQTATPTASKILVDDVEVPLTAYNIGGANYFKLRDIGQLFDFGVGWDNNTRTITIDSSTGYTE